MSHKCPPKKSAEVPSELTTANKLPNFNLRFFGTSPNQRGQSGRPEQHRKEAHANNTDTDFRFFRRDHIYQRSHLSKVFLMSLCKTLVALLFVSVWNIWMHWKNRVQNTVSDVFEFLWQPLFYHTFSESRTPSSCGFPPETKTQHIIRFFYDTL